MAYEDYLRALPVPESGGDPTATNPLSGAQGLYQIMPATQAGLRRQGFNLDMSTPEGQTRAAAELTRQNDVLLRSRLNRDPTDAERYFAHGFGGPAATYALAHPEMPLGQALRTFYGGTRQGEHFADIIYRQNPNLHALWDRPVTETVANFGTRLTGRTGNRPQTGPAPPAAPTVAGSPQVSLAPSLRQEGDTLSLSVSDSASDFDPTVSPMPTLRPQGGQQLAQAPVPVPPPPDAAAPAAPAAPTESPTEHDLALVRQRLRSATSPQDVNRLRTLEDQLLQRLEAERTGRPIIPLRPEGASQAAPSLSRDPSQEELQAAQRRIDAQAPEPGSFRDWLFRALPFMAPQAAPSARLERVAPSTAAPAPPAPPAAPPAAPSAPPTPPPAATGQDLPAVPNVTIPPMPNIPGPDYNRLYALMERMQNPERAPQQSSSERTWDTVLAGLAAGGQYRRGDRIGDVIGRAGAGSVGQRLSRGQEERTADERYATARAGGVERAGTLAATVAGQEQQGALTRAEIAQRDQQLRTQSALQLYNIQVNRMIAQSRIDAARTRTQQGEAYGPEARQSIMRGLRERFAAEADAEGARRHGGVVPWRTHIGTAQGQAERNAIMDRFLTTTQAGRELLQQWQHALSPRLPAGTTASQGLTDLEQ